MYSTDFFSGDKTTRQFYTNWSSGALHRGRSKQLVHKEAWALDDVFVRGLLLSRFPKMETNPNQRKQALVWLLIIHKYWRAGQTASTIAAYFWMQKYDSNPRPSWLKPETKRVERAIRRIRNAAAGLRTDGRKSTGRKRGRPKK